MRLKLGIFVLLMFFAIGVPLVEQAMAQGSGDKPPATNRTVTDEGWTELPATGQSFLPWLILSGVLVLAGVAGVFYTVRNGDMHEWTGPDELS